MHCSSCGKPVAQGFSFCNHCGARATEVPGHDAGKLSESSLNLLLGGILGIPIAGIGIIIGLMSVMKNEMGFGNGVIIGATLVSFLLLLAAEAVFIWLLINRTRVGKEKSGIAKVKDVSTKELGEVPVRALSEPVPSVTENTTRTFEPIHRASKTR